MISLLFEWLRSLWMPTAAKMDWATRRNQLESPFLKLPAEFRNQIYRVVLLDKTVWVHPRNCPALGWGPSHSPLALLDTCHQINHEALAIAFGACTFDFSFVDYSDGPTCNTFFRPWTNGQRFRASLIKHIVIHQSDVCGENDDLFTSMGRPAVFPALEDMEVYRNNDYSYTADRRKATYVCYRMVLGFRDSRLMSLIPIQRILVTGSIFYAELPYVPNRTEVGLLNRYLMLQVGEDR